jgi:hypothetical protein
MDVAEKKISKNLANMKFMQRGAVIDGKAKIEDKLENARDTHWVRGSIKASAEFVSCPTISSLQPLRSRFQVEVVPSMMAFEPLLSTARRSFGNFNPAVEQQEKEVTRELQKAKVQDARQQIEAKTDQEDRELASRLVALRVPWHALTQ